jgi:hypothetical protein
MKKMIISLVLLLSLLAISPETTNVDDSNENAVETQAVKDPSGGGSG